MLAFVRQTHSHSAAGELACAVFGGNDDRRSSPGVELGGAINLHAPDITAVKKHAGECKTRPESRRIDAVRRKGMAAAL
ncbi:hypothetical protein KM043_007822 [Ampulex compressa]|nr:hypothetical protein KM043_007822 [Ampulex compressa]